MPQEPPWLEQCKGCTFFEIYVPARKAGKDSFTWGICHHPQGPNWDKNHYCANFRARLEDGILIPDLDDELGGVGVPLDYEE